MAQDVREFAVKLTNSKIDRVALMNGIVLTAQGESERVTPVLTGNLKRSETTRVEGDGMRGYLGSNVDYAKFVHDGTTHMAARPFFEWGIEASRGTIDDLLKKAGEQFLEGLT